MIKTIDIAWLTGLLEGEGCFFLYQKRPGIKLQMCDEDVVVRAAALMKTTVSRYRNAWTTQINGARAIEWMMTLYPQLGERRREKVADTIKFWREHNYSNAPRDFRSMATCHPDRVVVAFDLCRPCYYRQWREKRLLKSVA
ncbi:hypothetical protein LCGC14_2860580 [marine sediment metagenome]|uniref:Homing endonuclease LAGLIDADG domain-containing protein n=1 Tax=marine sediment metagenome TaxID=412755 RepID=A0A0F9AE34_9ZZZZ